MNDLSEEDRREIARELDSVNDCLLRAAAEGDPEAQREALSYGVAALCRVVADVLRPPAPQRPLGQLPLWPDLA